MGGKYYNGYTEKIDVSMRIWVDSAQDGDFWRALVNAALYLPVMETIKLIRTCCQN
jgi:hypothetical protein